LHNAIVSDLYSKLEATAEELSINREKMWPKSPLWLSRRIREVLPLLRAKGIETVIGTSRKVGTQITLTKVPTDDGSDGGSKNRDTATFTATENPAEELAIDSGGSRGSKSEYSSPPLSRTREEKAAKAKENGSKTDTGLELPINTASTATGNETGTPNDYIQSSDEFVGMARERFGSGGDGA